MDPTEDLSGVEPLRAERGQRLLQLSWLDTGKVNGIHGSPLFEKLSNVPIFNRLQKDDYTTDAREGRDMILFLG
jgi:hypothetical protein